MQHILHICHILYLCSIIKRGPPGIFTILPGGFISPVGGFTSPPGERGRKNPPDAPNLGGVGNISDGTRFARHPRKTFSEQVFPTPARPRTYFPHALKMGGVGHISAGKEIVQLPRVCWHVLEQRRCWRDSRQFFEDQKIGQPRLCGD